MADKDGVRDKWTAAGGLLAVGGNESGQCSLEVAAVLVAGVDGGG